MGYLGLGDMVFLLPTLKSLREKFPNTLIHLLTGPYSAARELLKEGKDVDRVIPMDWIHANPEDRPKLLKKIGDEKYDVVLAGYTAPIRYFLPALTAIPVRIGHLRHYAPQWGTFDFRQRLSDWFRIQIWEEEYYRRALFNHPISIDVPNTTDHDIDKYLQLLEPLGIPPTGQTRHPHLNIDKNLEIWADDLLTRNRLDKSKILGISLGVSLGMEWKQWDLNRFAAVVDRLAEKHNFKVLLFGSAKDLEQSQKFENLTKTPFLSTLGQTTPLQMAALLKKCHLFVSNDCGPSKLAMAVGIPTGIIWGPSDRNGAGPWQPGPFLTLMHPISCSPCFRTALKMSGKDIINFSNCGHRNCLGNQTTEGVFNQIDAWISSGFTMGSGSEINPESN